MVRSLTPAAPGAILTARAFGRKTMSDEPVKAGIDRRGLLGAAGNLFLAEAVADNPAAQVEDRGAAVRITGMRTHRVAHKVYVQIETNHKVTGWGEVSAL